MIFDDFTDARLLVEAAKRLGFAEAGRRLGMPAATASRRIARLEDAAGARLFERTTRKVSLTEAGALLVRHAERMLAEAETASAALEAMNSAPQGEVRVAAPVVLGQALLGPIVRGFLADHPECDVSLNLTNRQVDLVEEGYDVAIRVRAPGDADLVARKLGTATTGLFADRTQNAIDVTTPTDLAGLQIGLVQPDNAPRDVIALAKPDEPPVSVPIGCHFWTTNPWVMIDAMAGTELIALMPRIVAKRLNTLRPILEQWSGPSVEVFAVFASRRLMRPAVRAFIDRLADELPKRLV